MESRLTKVLEIPIFINLQHKQIIDGAELKFEVVERL